MTNLRKTCHISEHSVSRNQQKTRSKSFLSIVRLLQIIIENYIFHTKNLNSFRKGGIDDFIQVMNLNFALKMDLCQLIVSKIICK